MGSAQFRGTGEGTAPADWRERVLEKHLPLPQNARDRRWLCSDPHCVIQAFNSSEVWPSLSENTRRKCSLGIPKWDNMNVNLKKALTEENMHPFDIQRNLQMYANRPGHKVY